MASEQVLRIRGALERFVGRVVVAVITHTTANLVAAPTQGGTPMDTSWASANWIPEIGLGTRTTPVGSRPEQGGAPASRGAQQAALASLLGYKFSASAPRPVSVINAVPYILPLNDGHSPQAAPGFVQRAIAKAITVDLAGFRAT